MGLCGVGDMVRACFGGASFEMLTLAHTYYLSAWPTLFQIYPNRDDGDDDAYTYPLFRVKSAEAVRCVCAVCVRACVRVYFLCVWFGNRVRVSSSADLANQSSSRFPFWIVRNFHLDSWIVRIISITLRLTHFKPAYYHDFHNHNRMNRKFIIDMLAIIIVVINGIRKMANISIERHEKHHVEMDWSGKP